LSYETARWAGAVQPGIDSQGRPASYLIGVQPGEQAGPNLFHSFSSFGIGSGETATFDGPSSIRNVISRVTGGTESDIYGTLRSTMPGADVYLLNPSGILFGAGAKLDVMGSFHATTADYIKLADGTKFEASAARPSVLSVAQPQAFGFLGKGAPAATVTVKGADLEGGAGASFSLVGGRVQVGDGVAPTQVSAPGGTLTLAAVGAAGVEVTPASGPDVAPTLNPATSAPLGEVQVAASAQVSADQTGAGFVRSGSVYIRGSHVQVDAGAGQAAFSV